MIDENTGKEFIPFLTLKTLAWDQKQRMFCSPTRTDFCWPPKAVVTSYCSRGCEDGEMGEACKCGLYGSPNPEALEEYETHNTSIIAIMHCLGDFEIWPGPDDPSEGQPLPDVFITRVWAAKIVGLVNDDPFGQTISVLKQRAILVGAQIYEIPVYPWEEAKDLIRHCWLNDPDIHDELGRPIDPYGGRIRYE